jgi:hypothetical protein
LVPKQRHKVAKGLLSVLKFDSWHLRACHASEARQAGLREHEYKRTEFLNFIHFSPPVFVADYIASNFGALVLM